MNALSMMFVATAVSIPWYLIIKEVGLIDNFWANIIPMLVTPVGVFLLKQFVDQLPDAVIEAARIDGANDYQIIWKIVLPLVKPSGNPSCWLGPIWGVSNYLVFRGLLKYGVEDEARALAEKTVALFEKDLRACGELHEYYDPESGEHVMNPGFQNWNLLSLNMCAWLNHEKVVEEF